MAGGTRRRHHHHGTCPGGRPPPSSTGCGRRAAGGRGGARFDLLFLKLAIARHQGAVSMTADVLSEGRNALVEGLVEEMANEVIAQLGAEIGRRMQRIQAKVVAWGRATRACLPGPRGPAAARHQTPHRPAAHGDRGDRP
ncbi:MULTISPECIES: DUF305 domain-containing protein [unclassified Streptomyces]|uniref:DUF305 domain-containing protein n=1 Tax=unclassified Streptomyces TaxID=2593676 RepID=UPI00315DBE90